MMSSSTSHIFSISLLFFITKLLLSVVYGYDGYSKCTSFRCGNFTNVRYPFWANDRPEYCGHPGFKLDCDGDNAVIDIMNQKYHIINLDYKAHTLKIARTDFWSGICPQSFVNITLDFNIFSITMNDQYATLLYDCDPTEDHPDNEFACPINNRLRYSYFTVPVISSNGTSRRCNISLSVPVLAVAIQGFLNDSMSVDQVLKGGFEVRWIINTLPCWDCINSGGMCGFNRTLNEFTCFCSDKAYSRTCSSSRSIPSPRHQGFPTKGLTADPHQGTLAGSVGIAITCTIICTFRWKISSILLNSCCGKISKTNQDLEIFIRNHGPLAPKRYNYSEVKKMTNSFKDKLGQGGYGGVYKGTLSDGCLIAVKLLNTSKGSGQDFINEVASISRTSHINVVSLLGYCLECSKRALIYEFMPNGSLEKFIYSGDTSMPTPYLGWDKMYEIVTGIARGLEYLHRGCNTRILHLDIKPHNILLDQDFCPKISDFGLAKLCPNKESILSMSEARGTIGYIAPEVFSRNFGNVSPKSDVYSYGMMILELVGCKNHLDVGVGHSSEIYFPHWIYRHVEKGKEFKLPGVVTSEENEIVKKMIIVGLWCIQARPSDRPPMNKVIEMLQFSIADLQIPPMPFLSSPPRPRIDSSTISTS